MTYFTMPLSATLPTARLRSELDRLFEDTFANTPTVGWSPAVDVRENATSFSLDVDLPGVSTHSLEVLAEEGVLTLKGEKPSRAAKEGERTLVSQRPVGAFVRRFRLPKNADASKIEAHLADGLLTIRVAKIAPAQPRRVTVQLNPEAVSAAAGESSAI